ncbi:Nudix family hydrolase [Algiphilus sp.]|uniref:Nudix family hydrolase n=2 Tax=Algiphilus sp. TaxID=1872431 RepID=UPI002A632B7B|nr:Nudix family hydrolase [Pseudomonadota bacterium]
MRDKRVRVAVAAMRDASGAVLLSQRPAHKSYPGQWEFPGGKIEPGESVDQALRRELAEELGIEVVDARPLIRVRHDYPELAVCLDVREVLQWSGTPTGVEGQTLAWVATEALPDWPLLAADAPIVRALQLPMHYAFSPEDAGSQRVLDGLARLPQDALLRLRLPALGDSEYRDLAEAVCDLRGTARLAVDRDPGLAQHLGCWWHVNGRTLERYAANRARLPQGSITSVHDAAALRSAHDLGAAAAVLGPVQQTASHPGAAAIGWSAFQALVDAAGLPVYAIGGMTPRDARRARDAGGQGVAGIRAFW